MSSLIQNPAFWGAISASLGVVLGFIAKVLLGNKETYIEERKLLTEEQFKLRRELRDDIIFLRNENSQLKEQIVLLQSQINALNTYVKKLELLLRDNKIIVSNK